ncbi:MAG: pseudouridine synthase [Bacteroidia bacterium]
MKVDKYIGQTGFLSRGKAYDLIGQKKVVVNGKLATYSTKINEGDVVLVNGVDIKTKTFVHTYIVYNKPKGVVCTTEKVEGNIIEAVNHPQPIFPVGRLDKDSEGLILLTSNKPLIDKIANPKFKHEKEYVVTLNLPVRAQFLKEISEGIKIQDERTKPCKVSMVPNTKRVFKIILTQGLNRQIRRMCNAYDYQVIKLERIRLMDITLGKLKPGEWRDLTKEELDGLLTAVEKIK